MPLIKKNGKWQWGENGKPYSSKKKAIKQGIAIEGPEKFKEEISKSDYFYDNFIYTQEALEEYDRAESKIIPHGDQWKIVGLGGHFFDSKQEALDFQFGESYNSDELYKDKPDPAKETFRYDIVKNAPPPTNPRAVALWEEIRDEAARAYVSKKERDEMNPEDFGDPDKKKFPVKDQKHLDAAVKLVGRESAEDQKKIKKRLKAIAKRKGLKLPDTWTD